VKCVSVLAGSGSGRWQTKTVVLQPTSVVLWQPGVEEELNLECP
jgi:hypothetical protein